MRDAARRLQLGLKSSAVALLVGLSTVAACNGDAALDPRSSTLTDTTYRNEFFGLTVAIPPGWSVASHQTEDHIRGVGAKAMAGDDPLLKATLDASEPVQLLTVTEYPVGAAVDFNSSLIVMAERVAHAPGVKTGEDYIFHLEKLLERSPVPYEPLGEITTLVLSGHAFSRRDFAVTLSSGFRQSYVVSREGDYVLAFILTAQDSKSLDALFETVAQAKLD